MYKKYSTPLADIARLMGVSRQRVWQMVRQNDGLCGQCGVEPLHLSSTLCDGCAEKQRLTARARVGAKPWVEGGPGRKPFHALDK